MSYDKVKQAHKIIVGSKQTVKALKNGIVEEVLIASNADPRITAKVIDTAEKMNIPITYVDSMETLGRVCGLEVAAATVALTY